MQQAGPAWLHEAMSDDAERFRQFHSQTSQSTDVPIGRLQIIGAHTVRLNGTYDPRQRWLDFVAAVLPPQIVKHAVVPLTPERVKLWMNARHAQVPPGHRTLFHDEPGVSQMVLPFPGRLRISTKSFKRNGPVAVRNFERRSGKVACFGFDRQDQPSLLEWCEENCTARYVIDQGWAVFELWRDAALARLVVDPPRT